VVQIKQFTDVASLNLAELQSLSTLARASLCGAFNLNNEFSHKYDITTDDRHLKRTK